MADTQTATLPETGAAEEPTMESQRSRAEELLARRRAALEEREAAQRAAAHREPTIGFGEFLLMLFFAGLFDLVSIVPGLNLVTWAVGTATFAVWFYFKKIPFRQLRLTFGAESVVELIPGLSALPGFIGLIIATFIIVRTRAVAARIPGGKLISSAIGK